jgi:hypothetical protein
MYTVAFSGIAVSAAQDLIELIGAADKVCLLHRVVISDDTSETAESLPVQVIRRTTTGSGGSAVTPVKVQPGDAAASFTANRNVTTPGSASDVIVREGRDVVSGWEFHPAPEGRPTFAGTSARLCVHLVTAPGASRTLSGWALVEEIG